MKVERVIELISPAYYTGLVEEEIKNRWIDYWYNLYGKNK
jgi:hypothetical protein